LGWMRRMRPNKKENGARGKQCDMDGKPEGVFAEENIISHGYR
jgi:hypothetical protein